MIAMTLAEVAAAIGVPVPAARTGDVVVRSVEFDTPQGRTRHAVRGAARRTRRRARVRRHAARRPVRSPCSAPARSSAVCRLLVCPGDDSTVLCRRWPPWRTASVTALVAARAGGHRRHRLGRQDVDEGPDRRGARRTAGDRPIAPPESFNNELGHPYTVLRADECDAGTWCWSCPPAAPGTSRRWPRSRRRGSAPCSTSARRTSASSARSRRSRRPSRELVERRCRPPRRRRRRAERRRSRWSPRWPAGTTAEVVTSVGRRRRCGRPRARRQDRRPDRAAFTLITPEGGAPVALRVVGAHQVGNALTAAAVGRAVGLTVDQVAAALLGAPASARKWRMDVTDLAGGITLDQRRLQRQPALDEGRAAVAVHHRPRPAHLGGARRDGRAGRGTNGPAHDETRPAGGAARHRPADRGRTGGAAGATFPAAPGPALHLGAHLEGSWGGESGLGRGCRLPRSPCSARSWRPVTWCWSRPPASAGLERVAG